MKKNQKVIFAVCCCLCVTILLAGAAGVGEEQKAKISSIIKDLKEKARKSKPVKYEVALPVATAGARGAEVKQSDRFGVIWPNDSITPLTALAENLSHAVEHGERSENVRTQLEDFKKAFPEFAGEKLIKDLAEVIPQPK